MPWQTSPYEEANMVITAGQTVSTTVHIRNPAELGLLVPTLTSTTVAVHVGNQSDGSDHRGLVDSTGNALLSYAAGTGNFAISTNSMGACLGYAYMTIVIGTVQGSNRTVTLTMKAVDVT